MTGAARGIGAATAKLLAGRGWSVGLIDGGGDDDALGYSRASASELRASLEACRAAGAADAASIAADVRDAAAVRDAVESLSDRLGPVDAAAAVAGGIAGATPGWATPEAVWREMIDLNLGGVRHLAEAVLPAMLAAPAPRTGRFVAVASTAGLLGLRHLGAYAAAKHAVVGYVRSLAADLGDSGITANAVAPGSTRTAMLDASARIYDLDSVEEFAVHHALGRLLEPAEPAAAIAWLCSVESGGMTGALVPVDAGMTATA